jgi:hypothetical protein
MAEQNQKKGACRRATPVARERNPTHHARGNVFQMCKADTLIRVFDTPDARLRYADARLYISEILV